jgi:hypothetical protein
MHTTSSDPAARLLVPSSVDEEVTAIVIRLPQRLIPPLHDNLRDPCKHSCSDRESSR